MKKNIIVCLVTIFLLFSATPTRGDSRWDISIREWGLVGSFDYTLYYPYSSQVISKVDLPQNQLMTILEAKYITVNEKNFIKVEYGWTDAEIKGRGSDSDWRIEGSDILTDYGELDAYGKQKLVAIDLGTVIIKNEVHETNLVLGWSHWETTNELKNIVYHLSDEIDIGNQSQPDNGSYLDGEFSGLLFGINETLKVRPNLFFAAEVKLSFLNTKAYGHWANHIPAWNWENDGKAIGYVANLGLRYALSDNIRTELGYYYNYAKAGECAEALNGEMIPQLADLEYERQGLHLGLALLF